MNRGEVIKQSSLVRAVNQQLVRRAVEAWDRGGCGSFAVFLLKFVHVYWKEVLRWN